MASTSVLDADVVSALIVSGAHCVACIARKAALPIDRVTMAFHRIEAEWCEPLVDSGRCVSCGATTTVYSLKLP